MSTALCADAFYGHNFPQPLRSAHSPKFEGPPRFFYKRFCRIRPEIIAGNSSIRCSTTECLICRREGGSGKQLLVYIRQRVHILLSVDMYAACTRQCTPCGTHWSRCDGISACFVWSCCFADSRAPYSYVHCRSFWSINVGATLATLDALIFILRWFSLRRP